MIDIKILGATQLANALSDKQQMRVERVKMLLDAVQLLEDEAKKRAPEKIDDAVALLMAYGALLTSGDTDLSGVFGDPLHA